MIHYMIHHDTRIIKEHVDTQMIPGNTFVSTVDGVDTWMIHCINSAGNVAVMVPAFAHNLLLLSPVIHWGVLINTNDGHGCEEGIQTLTIKVFAYHKLCDAYTYASRGSGDTRSHS